MQILIPTLIVIGGILSFVGGIMLLMAAFKEGPGWGLAVLFLPFAGLVFLCTHWEEAKAAFLVQVAAMAVVGIGFGVATAQGVSMIGQLIETVNEEGLGGTNAEALLMDMANVLPTSSDETDEEAADEAGGIQGPRDLTGLRLDEVKRLYGRPKGEMEGVKGTSLLYGGFTVFSDDGEVVTFVQVEKGAEKLKPSGRTAADAGEAQATGVAPVQVIRRNGARISLKDIVEPGHVTIVDFFADWCGPCREISPQLEQIARNDPVVVLRKVDIVKWETDVCRQYSIRSVPNIRVYDRAGHMIGKPTSLLSTVRENVAKAK